MKHTTRTPRSRIQEAAQKPGASRLWGIIATLLAAAVLSGCGTSQPEKKDEFFTSGSREADQRASRRMAKEEQLAGSDKEQEDKDAAGGAAQAEGKRTLHERLGGDPGITAIVEDFIPRVLEDPRVNWTRKGVDRGGLFKRGQDVLWQPTAQNVAALKLHMIQFFSLATGGPARYEGKDMQNAHGKMRISNPEFDAVVGDLKASLDRLQIANQEQKELLAIVESTRPQIVTER